MPATALPPGPRLPPAVQRLALRVAWAPFTDASRRRYGDVVLFNTRPPVVTVSGPELCKQVLRASPRQLGLVDARVRAVIGERSLVVLEEEDHLYWRRRLSPALHGDALRSYAGLIRDRTDHAIDSWPMGEPFTLVAPLQRLTRDIIARITLGPREGPRREELLDAVGELVRGATSRARVEELLADERPAMDLGDQTLMLLVGGSESTAASVAWTLELLLRHPATLEGLGDDRYLAAVLKESLRLHPPVPFVPRRVKEVPYELGGFLLQPGTEIHASVGRPTDPEFRPERFLDGADPTSLPFGAGPHRCLGARFATLEAGIMIRRVLERVQLRLLDRRPEKGALDGFATVPARGLRVIAEPRC